MITLDAKASNFDLHQIKDRFKQNPVNLALPQESNV